jgi:hypothetical protein
VGRIGSRQQPACAKSSAKPDSFLPDALPEAFNPSTDEIVDLPKFVPYGIFGRFRLSFSAFQPGR